MKFGHQPFQIFTKPVGSTCNLRCSYCYYHSDSLKNNVIPTFLNNAKLLESYIIQHIEATPDDVVFFSWHGGEPTLAGIGFYKKVVLLQKKHLPDNKQLINGIQTNGILIDEEWCRFFKQENFLVGISIDGPEMLHNKFRIDKKGNGSFQTVFNSFKLLSKYEIPVEIVCVVNSANQDFPRMVYDFFRESGAKFITFLPLVEPDLESEKHVTERSVDPVKFGNFLAEIFDEWTTNDIGKIQIQIFNEAVSTVLTGDHTICIFKKNCGRVPVIESNGDFYSCDHFVNRSNFFGNISENTILNYLNSEKQEQFGLIKSETLTSLCRKCKVLEFCNGECPKNRFIEVHGENEKLNYLCEGYKLFFNHCMPFVMEVKKNAGIKNW